MDHDVLRRVEPVHFMREPPQWDQGRPLEMNDVPLMRLADVQDENVVALVEELR